MITLLLSRLRHRPLRKGQALTELALCLPVMFLLLFGLIEIGLMIKTKMVLQDAARSALRYGAEAGTVWGSTNTGGTTTAPGCLADYATLDAISNRLQSSLIDTSRVRSVLIYAAGDNSDNPQDAPASTNLQPPNPVTPPRTGAPNIYGDYYYADYNTSTGLNISEGGTGTGTGKGAIYKLFNGGIDSIFTPYTTATFPTLPAAPACGSTLSDQAGMYNDDNPSGGTAGPGVGLTNSNAAKIASDIQGDWPPRWRNSIGGTANGTEIPPDHYAVDIVYDYQFKTPLFQPFFGLFGLKPYFRMDERATMYLNPQQ